MSSITLVNPFFPVKALQQSAREAQQLQATLAERHQEADFCFFSDGPQRWQGTDVSLGNGGLNHGVTLVVGWFVSFFF